MNTDTAFNLLAALVDGGDRPLIGEDVMDATFEGKVYSKGRPRFGNGHAFTPKNTREFEKTVKNWLIGECGEPVNFPCAVEITLYDAIPKSAPKWLRRFMEDDIIFSSVGDVDNRAKAILDAAIGVVYENDGQVVDLRVHRHYDGGSGFRMVVIRAGVSAAELDQLREAHNNGK